MIQISLKDAENIIDNIIAKAREEMTAPMGVVVLDSGGHIIAYKREDSAAILRFDIARGKAKGAISLGINSRKFAEMAEQRPAFISSLGSLTDGNIIPSAGGVLIYNNEKEVIGAVGVSGDLPDIDEKCAIEGIKKSGFNI